MYRFNKQYLREETAALNDSTERIMHVRLRLLFFELSAHMSITIKHQIELIMQ